MEIDATLLLDSTAANNEIAGLLVGVVEARAAPDEFEQRAPHRVEFGRVDERIHADVQEGKVVIRSERVSRVKAAAMLNETELSTSKPRPRRNS